MSSKFHAQFVCHGGLRGKQREVSCIRFPGGKRSLGNHKGTCKSHGLKA